MFVRRSSRVLAVLVIVGVALAACTTDHDSSAGPANESGDTVVAQGYPPPGGTLAPPAPTATPAADSSGYYPPPVGLTERIESIEGSPHAEMLLPLQMSFEAGSSEYLSERSTERFGVTLYDVSHIDSEGGEALDTDGAGTLLDAFFDAGSRPLIQGYFESADDEVLCAVVVASPFEGSVEHPSAADPAPYGPRPPSHIPADSAGFRLCRVSEGDWLWQDWMYGGYHQIIERLDDARGADGWRYVVIRP